MLIPIEEIKDAKTVAKDYESMLEGAQIVAVSQFGSYKACMRCGARVEPSTIHLEDVPYLTRLYDVTKS